MLFRSAQWPELLKRPAQDFSALESAVRQTLTAVRQRGDAALRELTARFDGVELEDFRVPAAELEQAAEHIDPALREALATAHRNIEAFHAPQLTEPEVIETLPGVRCWRKSVGIDKVGLYIPGGTAPLFSTVLMLGVPARLAGCREIVLCTPPGKDGKVPAAILAAARLCGIEQVFRVGGAQAIAAMAYGTETIPAVYKIFGPGNAYVTVAKQLVSQEGPAIDMPAGPSEVLVCADSSAEPRFVAADLLSQAEHGSDSQVVLLCFDTAFAESVLAAVEDLLATLPRRELAAASLANSVALVAPDRDTAIAMINDYAPEHLIIATRDARELGERITNAGSVFLGHYTPESVGDYASGTNHTLPTNGYARQYSGVSVDSFVKKITFQELSPDGLRNLGPTVETMAAAEELEAHRLAVSLRLDTLP